MLVELGDEGGQGKRYVIAGFVSGAVDVGCFVGGGHGGGFGGGLRDLELNLRNLGRDMESND